MTFTEQLQELNACRGAIKWVNGRSLRKCWQVADRADWMLWLAANVEVDRKALVMAACDCAEMALNYVPKGEGRPRIAIETARAWCGGDATIEQVRKAAFAARAAAFAAYAAADAARAVAAAAFAAHAVAFAAYAAHAADAAAYAADAVAGKATHKKLCRLIRKRIPVELIEENLR